MHRIVWMMALLVALPAAAAQGPAPGYGDAVSYGADYAAWQAENASADPMGYAKAHASKQAAQGEVNHTLYIACWAADDHGIRHEACDAYYTPPGEAAPQQPEPEHNQSAQEVLNTTQDLVREVVDAVNDTVADPGSAPGQLERVVTAASGFLGDVADALARAVDGLLGAAHGTLAAVGKAGDLLIDGGLAVAGKAADAALGAVDILGAGSQVATDSLHGAAGAAAGGVAEASRAVAAAMEAAARATGGALEAAARGVGQTGSWAAGAMATAVQATGHALADAAKATGSAVAEAAGSVRDAFTSMFEGSDEAPGLEAPETPDPPGAEGLLDGLPRLLE